MKKITDIIWVIVLVCIFFIPFISSDVYQSTFSILCSVLLFSLFIHAILTKTYLKDHTITFWLLAWFSIIFTASLLCQHRNVALSSTYYFFLYGAIFFVISGLDYKKRRQVLIIIALASIFISIRGILQNLYSFKTVIPYIGSQKSVMSVKEFQHIKDVIERGRVVSSFVTANLFASYLTLVNFAVLRLIATIKRKTIVLALASLFLVNFFCLLLTASVAGLGAFTFGVFMFSVFSFLIVPKEKSALRKTCISLGIATTLLFVLLFAKRFFDTGTDNLLLSLEGRIQFWRTSLYIIKTRPFSFAGLGNFGYLFQKFAISPKAESIMAHKKCRHFLAFND